MTQNPKVKPKRKANKLNGRAKITIAALGMLSFVSSWDLIARQAYQKEAQAGQPGAAPPPVQALSPDTSAWPTIPPLPNLTPIPTLEPTLVSQLAAGLGQTGAIPSGENQLLQIAPLPTLAPLATLAPLPSMPAPPPPPPPPPSGGGGHRSGGS